MQMQVKISRQIYAYQYICLNNVDLWQMQCTELNEMQVSVALTKKVVTPTSALKVEESVSSCLFPNLELYEIFTEISQPQYQTTVWKRSALSPLSYRALTVDPGKVSYWSICIDTKRFATGKTKILSLGHLSNSKQ